MAGFVRRPSYADLSNLGDLHRRPSRSTAPATANAGTKALVARVLEAGPLGDICSFLTQPDVIALSQSAKWLTQARQHLRRLVLYGPTGIEGKREEALASLLASMLPGQVRPRRENLG
jgi:hypothetical protein